MFTIKLINAIITLSFNWRVIKMEKTYFCIDLKTFYASVECVERNLDPFSTNLVVADESRGKGSICLAISPKMKMLGIRNRCRLYEIPSTIKYIIAKPRMKKYIETLIIFQINKGKKPQDITCPASIIIREVQF